MRNIVYKSAIVITSCAMLLSYTACNTSRVLTESNETLAETEEPVQASITVTVEADGKTLVLEGMTDKTVSQLMEETGITLGKNAILSVDPEQKLTEGMTIRVLPQRTISLLIIPYDEEKENIEYTAVIYGDTVEDAVNALGISLSDYNIGLSLNFELKDNMTIVIYEKPEIPEDTEEYSEDDEYGEEDGGYYYGNSNGGGSGSSGGSSSGNSGGSSSFPAPTETSPTAPQETEPAPTERTIVRTEIYEDCDGSGHGVKVITYSDGTQEEILF